MTVPNFSVNIRTSGPVFDGRAARALTEYGDAVEQEVAEEGARMVRQRLHTVLRHPTGYYESQVRAEAVGERWQVNDSGVIYGPWLEGTGSRNSPVTRFPGYATFRRTKALLDRQARGIAQRVLPRYLRRMN